MRRTWQIYYMTSVLVFGVGLLFLVLSNTNLRWYLFSGGVLLIDLLLLGSVKLIRGIRREGKRFLRILVYSIRFQLTLWFMSLLLLILVIFGNTVYALMYWSLTSSLDRTLGTRLLQVASSYNLTHSTLALPGAPSSQEIVVLLTPQGKPRQTFLDPSVKEQEIVRIIPSITTSNTLQQARGDITKRGQALRTLKNGAEIYMADFSISRHLAGGDYHFDLAVIADQQQRPVAFVLVGMQTTIFFWLNTLVIVLWLTAGVTLLAVGGCGYWLAQRAISPVLHITNAARQISEADLHQRLKLPQRNEFGELADTFDHMLERLETAFERQRQFTSNVSHELRTPLAIVELEVTRGLTRDLPRDEYRRILSITQQEIHYMSQLVNDLLILARADAGQSRLCWQEVDLSEVVLDTIERLAPLAQETGMSVHIAPLSDLTIQGDPTFLMQLLTNLVENALKYSASSGAGIVVDMSQQEQVGSQWVRVRVIDDGPGIAEEHLPHLFERFYRTDQSRTHHREEHMEYAIPTIPQRGSGLGLSIAQWIAQQHGGTIQVQSQYGKGTTFEVWLPLTT